MVLESECPRYDELLAQLNSSPDVRKRMDSNKEMLDYLAVKSGLNMTEIDDFEYLYDTLFIEVSIPFQNQIIDEQRSLMNLFAGSFQQDAARMDYKVLSQSNEGIFRL